ncbi:zinc knuckle-domain-containing protein [Coniella lustricola]|uniref:Zinc knuckle-domain-containing protein n=1 Tax=Coniella lustricola TaxID=2025994 RepID=A0A2T3A2S1_9PEZI|nr:zinc knuckle-domain-containing protein [Coniella lustricola]
MYAFNRGGGGRRQPTPANVQCQKCLKRGHYSYECKTQPQERPYKARPSRTQQLLNPDLAPKLTNDALEEATRK